MSERHIHEPAMAKAIGRPPEVRTMTVVAVTFRRGEGCCEADPVREVIAYYALDGEVLAEHDPVAQDRSSVRVDAPKGAMA